MARARKTRSWWTTTVARWRKSGLTAAEFASREGLSVWSLRWWSSELRHGTRACRHGSGAIEAIEIAVPNSSRAASGVLEIAVADAVVRFDASVGVAYVASLVRALAGR
jgi:hypothetical protein